MLENWLIDIACIAVILGMVFGVEYVTGRKMFGRAERAHLVFEEAGRGLGLMSAVLLGIVVVAGCAAVYFWYV